MNYDETNLYGWKMRLLQVEEDISFLNKQKKMCEEMIESAKERIKDQIRGGK